MSIWSEMAICDSTQTKQIPHKDQFLLWFSIIYHKKDSDIQGWICHWKFIEGAGWFSTPPRTQATSRSPALLGLTKCQIMFSQKLMYSFTILPTRVKVYIIFWLHFTNIYWYDIEYDLFFRMWKNVKHTFKTDRSFTL